MATMRSRVWTLFLAGALGASFGAAAECTDTDTAICLNNGRFRVTAQYSTSQGQTGAAHTVRLTSDTAYLWFFNANNVEMVVKVLNACGVNNRYWVFAGGLTNVRVELTVEDTNNSTSQLYVNPQGTAFQPIQDTNAFVTCP